MDHHAPVYTIPPAKNTNWVLLGCGGCLGLVVVVLLLGAAVGFFTIQATRKTSVYQTALAGAQNSPAVQAALGTPIAAGIFPTQSSINVVNDSGAADLTIPVSGPRGPGSIHYRAQRTKGVWRTIEHTVTVPGRDQPIDLQVEVQP